MYKESKYNYLVRSGSQILFHNGITGNCFCMTETEWHMLKKMLSSVDEFQKSYPADFQRLRRMGYIIDDDFDEKAYLLFKNKMEVYGGRQYHITLNPTLECNFRCWYCYETHESGVMSNAIIGRVKKHIRRKIEEEHISGLVMSWFGGEPLLCFDIVEQVSKYARKLCKKNKVPLSLSMTTNGYLISRDMLPILKKIGLASFQITLDGDRKRHNEIRNSGGKPSFDKIVENINMICHEIEGAYVLLRINYDEVTFERKEIVDILDMFDETIRDKIEINIQKVWQVATGKKDSESKFFDDFTLQAYLKGYRLSYGGSIRKGECHSCYASRCNYSNINYDGLVYKCTARDYAKDNAVGYLKTDGSIEWDLKILSKMYKCTPFESKECVECRYLPLCGGPCMQKYYEKGFFCVHNDKSFFEDEIVRQYRNNIVKFNNKNKHIESV